MRRWIWLAILVVACSAPTSASSNNSASHPSTPSPSTCRLPVIEGSRGQGSGPQTPGFLNLPGSTITSATGAGDGMFYDRQLARWVPWGPPTLAADGLSYVTVDGDSKSTRIHLIDLGTNSDVVLAQGGRGGSWACSPTPST